jgi:hypothetical protein
VKATGVLVDKLLSLRKSDGEVPMVRILHYVRHNEKGRPKIGAARWDRGAIRDVGRVLDLQIGRRFLAGAPIGFNFVRDFLPILQAAQACPLDRADVHENILAAIVRLNEAITLRLVEPFYSASRHLVSSPSWFPLAEHHVPTLRWRCRQKEASWARQPWQ